MEDECGSIDKLNDEKFRAEKEIGKRPPPLDDNGLRRQELFKRLVQSLIELSNAGSEERSLLKSLGNHVQARGATVPDRQGDLLAQIEE